MGLWLQHPLAVFANGAVLDFFPAKIFAVMSSEPCTYKFTIDKRPDLLYAFACYLVQRSPTSHPATALTLAPSITCSLFVVAKKVNPFGIKQIQPLFPKCRGVGWTSRIRASISLHLRVLRAPTSVPSVLSLFLNGSANYL